MKTLKKWICSIENFIENTLMGLLVLMVILVFFNVISRAVLSHSFRWSEELPLILLNWFCILGMAVGIGRKSHVAIEYFYSNMSKSNKIIISYFVFIVSLIFGGVLLQFGITNIVENLGVYLPATGLSQGVKYCMFPVAGILIILYSIVDIYELKKTKKELKTMLEEEVEQAKEVAESVETSGGGI